MNQPYLQRFFVVLFSLFILSSSLVAQPDGAAIFSNSCSQCHSVGKGTVIGPDLKDVHKKRPEDWLQKWIKSSASVRKSGDAYAIALYEKFNKTEMPDQNLSPDEIKAVIAYIKTESEKAPVVKVVAGGGGEQAATEDNLVYYLLGAALVLFVLVMVLSKVKKGLDKVVREKQGLPEPAVVSAPKRLWVWMKGHKKLVAVIFIALNVYGSVKTWYALASIGIQQNYQPDQPIAFSHKLHAGEMQIACIYCHSGAEKSKTAGVPSANVCMNCHKGIKEGKTTGTTEIAKIYAALDYDPATQTYGTNQKPIEWTRVHNLPDFAYFNHSQHVKVGGVKCQTCHGEVQDEMTVAKQFAPLTMGWCIDCHRRTPVNMKDNHYYDNYHAVATLLNKKGRDSTITVEKIGGTECARCHY